MASYLKIGGYDFAGPFSHTRSIQDSSGLYAILDNTGSGYEVIDIGEAGRVRTRLETHDRKECWQMNKRGRLVMAVLYTPRLQSSGRCEIESALRKQYDPPCGLR